LIWFAAGAACASGVAAIAQIADLDPAPELGWFLVVAEQHQSMHDGEESAVWQGGKIARDCGAHSFEMIPRIAQDASDRTRIPLVRENSPATNCVMERAAQAGIWFGVGLEPRGPSE